MNCKFCKTEMVHWDDEGSIGFASFDDYICLSCMARCYKAEEKEQWTEYKDWYFKDSFGRAVAHLIIWKGYKLVKEEEKE